MNLFKRNSAAPRGFTIIEIALCLGIIGFALVAIIAALPRGLDVQKRNREETIIGHDADIFMSAIRSGARGYDDLTNYVLCITNFWTQYGPNYQVIGNPGYDYYTVSNSGRTSIRPATDDFPLTNGAHIIGILSTPKFTPTTVSPVDPMAPPYQSNYVVAYVRSISGAAVDKVPQNNPVILGDSFIYRMIVENFPYMPLDTNGLCLDCLATNGLTKEQLIDRTNQILLVQAMQTNVNDLRLRFRWPVLPGGRVQDFNATFRAMVDGRMQETNDPGSTAQPLYFVQPSTFYFERKPSP